jgi:hypothetical protein
MPGTLAATVAVITVTGCSVFMAFPGFLVDPASEPSTPQKGQR